MCVCVIIYIYINSLNRLKVFVIKILLYVCVCVLLYIYINKLFKSSKGLCDKDSFVCVCVCVCVIIYIYTNSLNRLKVFVIKILLKNTNAQIPHEIDEFFPIEINNKNNKKKINDKIKKGGINK